MDVVRFTDTSAFAEHARPVIERHPAECTILATFLEQSLAGVALLPTDWFLITQDAGPGTGADAHPVAAAMHTPPFNVLITPLPQPPDDRQAAVGALIDVLLQVGRPPLGVTGRAADAQTFAEAWRQLTGVPHRPEMTEVLYEIGASPVEPDVPGRARRVTDSDDDVLVAASWLRSFEQELHPERPMVNAEKVIRNRVTHGHLFFWEVDGQPVAMAGLHSPAAGIGRIGPVYTQGAYRRRGYGRAVTVAATRVCFDLGARTCVLFADAANPTSNGVYRAIGYRQVGEALMIGFHPDERIGG
jgi:predicted GNAT family acetyltransferase